MPNNEGILQEENILSFIATILKEQHLKTYISHECLRQHSKYILLLEKENFYKTTRKFYLNRMCWGWGGGGNTRGFSSLKTPEGEYMKLNGWAHIMTDLNINQFIAPEIAVISCRLQFTDRPRWLEWQYNLLGLSRARNLLQSFYKYFCGTAPLCSS